MKSRIEQLRWQRHWFKRLSTKTETSNLAEWAEETRQRCAKILVQIDEAIEKEEAKRGE